MASSSQFFFIVSTALVSQLLLGSASALRLISTTYIDKLCSQRDIDNKTFCLQTLSAYPHAASAKAMLPLAEAVIGGIVLAQANKAADFAAAQKDPTFKECHDAFVTTQHALKSAYGELVEDPPTANYDVMTCYDDIKRVKDSIGKRQDRASKTLMQMTRQMTKLISLALAATDVVGG